MNNIEIQREEAVLNNKSEDEVENELVQFVQKIVNEYSQRNNEYIKFVCLFVQKLSMLMSLF